VHTHPNKTGVRPGKQTRRQQAKELASARLHEKACRRLRRLLKRARIHAIRLEN
jgi:hypothetical protein